MGDLHFARSGQFPRENCLGEIFPFAGPRRRKLFVSRMDAPSFLSPSRSLIVRPCDQKKKENKNMTDRVQPTAVVSPRFSATPREEKKEKGTEWRSSPVCTSSSRTKILVCVTWGESSIEPILCIDPIEVGRVSRGNRDDSYPSSGINSRTSPVVCEGPTTLTRENRYTRAMRHRHRSPRR